MAESTNLGDTNATITIEDLSEFQMHDGYSWLAEGARGRTWSIIWQPEREADNIRAWPFPAGRTAHRGNAQTLDAARVQVLEIARKIANGTR